MAQKTELQKALPSEAATPRRLVTREFLTFMITGAARAAMAYAIFAVFVFVGLHYTWATLISSVCGVLAGYLMNHHWVFMHEGDNRFFRFLLAFGVAYLLSIGSQRGLIASGWVDSPYLSGAIAAGICAVPNFLMNKYFVFAPRSAYVR